MIRSIISSYSSFEDGSVHFADYEVYWQRNQKDQYLSETIGWTQKAACVRRGLMSFSRPMSKSGSIRYADFWSFDSLREDFGSARDHWVGRRETITPDRMRYCMSLDVFYCMINVLIEKTTGYYNDSRVSDSCIVTYLLFLTYFCLTLGRKAITLASLQTGTRCRTRRESQYPRLVRLRVVFSWSSHDVTLSRRTSCHMDSLQNERVSTKFVQ